MHQRTSISLSQPGKFIVADQTGDFTGEADKLRWFMLPSEASNIVNNKKVDLVTYI